MGRERTGIRWLGLGAGALVAVAALCALWVSTPGGPAAMEPGGGRPGVMAPAGAFVRWSVWPWRTTHRPREPTMDALWNSTRLRGGRGAFGPFDVSGLRLHALHLNQGSLYELHGEFDGNGLCRMEGLPAGRYVLIDPIGDEGEHSPANSDVPRWRLRPGLEFPAVHGVVIVQDAPFEPVQGTDGVGQTEIVPRAPAEDRWEPVLPPGPGQGAAVHPAFPNPADSPAPDDQLAPAGVPVETAGALAVRVIGPCATHRSHPKVEVYAMDRSSPWSCRDEVDGEGLVRFDGIQPGRYRLHVGASAGYLPRTEEVMVPPGRGVWEATIRPTRPGGLDLSLDWPRGAHPGRVEVVAYDGEHRGLTVTEVQVDRGLGTATLRGLAPGKKRLALCIEEAASAGPPAHRLISWPAHVAPDQTVPVHIPLPPKGWTWIQGWVTSGPLSKGNVSLVPVLDGVVFGPVKIPISGRFRLRVPCFSAGTLRLVEDFEGTCEELELAANRDPSVPVTLAIPDGQVVVRLDPTAERQIPCDARLALIPDEGGAAILRALDYDWGFWLHHVPAGRYRAHIRVGGSEQPAPAFGIHQVIVPDGPGRTVVEVGLR